MKKIKVKTTKDVEILYQKFKKKMIAGFRANKDSKEVSAEVKEWMAKKTGMSDQAIDHYLLEFTKTLLVDPGVDQEEWRNEK